MSVADPIRVVVAEDQEQVDKLLKIKALAPDLEHVVFYDPHGLESYTQEWLLPFDQVEEAGADDLFAAPQHPYTAALMAAAFEMKAVETGMVRTSESAR